MPFTNKAVTTENIAIDLLNNSIVFFTIILYLTDWQKGDGGELMIYTDQGEVKVEPHQGSFVIFTSETEHEVLPVFARRYSITGWITDVPIGLTFL